MTTKEEVLKLAKAAGFTVMGDEILYGSGGMIRNAYSWFHELIELAKAQGAVEEREACAKWASGWFDNHPEDIAEAIRNRERKE